MYEELNLKGARLFSYSIIYDLCRRKGEYRGGNSLLIQLVKCDKRKAQRTLRALEKAGLIARRPEMVNNRLCQIYTLCYDPAEKGENA